MRSRAEWRRVAERALRATLLVALAAALVRAYHDAGPARSVRRTDVRGLPSALAQATQDARVGVLEVTVDSFPGRPELAWLVALRRAGTSVVWRGDPPAVVVAVERARDPLGRVSVRVAAGGASVALADSAGPLDRLALTAGGGALGGLDAVGAVRAGRGRFVATALVPPAVPPRAVLVLGRAAWEARFTAAALAEAGWTVRSREVVAPGVVVGDAGILPIDTSRYAAAIVLDTSAADLAPALARFARAGGGLVLAGDASSLAAFAPLAPTRTGSRRPGRVVLDADTVTRADLPRRALSSLRTDAVALEGSRDDPIVAVRRVGIGRVASMGYEDSWRWRMLGGADGGAAHRAWWSRLTGSVAPDRSPRPTADASRDAAPLATLGEALGSGTRATSGASETTRAAPLPLVLLVLLVLAALAETASRRFRGAT